MKRLFSILLLLTLLNANAFELPVTKTNTGFFRFDSSYKTLNTAGCYLDAARYLYWPRMGIRCYNFSRSGGSIEDANETRLERLGLSAWENCDDWFSTISVDNNGGYTTTNQVFAQATNTFNAPGLLYNGSAYTNEGGWASAHSGQIKWIGCGDIPQAGHYIPPVDSATRDGGMTNCATLFGYMAVEVFYPLNNFYGWSNDIASGADLRQSSIDRSALPCNCLDGEHPGPAGGLSIDLNEASQEMDTNVNTATLDISNGAISTNHCVVSGLTITASSASFNWLADRHSIPWDFPDGTITNDSTKAFVMQPALSNLFYEVIVLRNVPNGNYSVSEDGEAILSGVASNNTITINLYSLMRGAAWRQRVEVLARVRDKRGCDRVTLQYFTDAGGINEHKYDGVSQTAWNAGYRGDALVSQLASQIAILNSNDVRIAAAAMPTNHAFTVSLPQPIFAPFHR